MKATERTITPAEDRAVLAIGQILFNNTAPERLNFPLAISLGDATRNLADIAYEQGYKDAMANQQVGKVAQTSAVN